MESSLRLKDAERKVFRATFQDGLWDVFIGCVVLQFAVAPLLSTRLGDFWSSVVFLPFWALVFGIIWLVRKSVVVPRLGSVRLGPSRKTRLKKFTGIMLAVNLVALLAGIVFAIRADVSSGLMYMALFGFIVLVLFSTAAYFLECVRFFVYGVLFVLSFVVGEWLFAHYSVRHHGFPITFGLTSVIIITVGLVHFVSLLRRYQVPAAEPASDESAS
jgi:lysylphosphatidylglycerol synthetase-like protein (DUF2156 family)